VRFTRDGSYLLSTSKVKKLIHLWNPYTSTHISSFCGHRKEVRDVDVNKTNSGLVSCGGDIHVFKWDVESSRVVGKYRGHEREVNAVRYDEYSSHVFVSGSTDQSIRIWDARSKNSCIQTLGKDYFKDSVLTVGWANGWTVFGGSVAGNVTHFDVRHRAVKNDTVHDPVTSVCSNERYILVACMGGKIRLLDQESGDLLQTFTGHTHAFSKLQAVLSPDEGSVISCSEDGHLCVWETVRGDESLYKVLAHRSAVTSCDVTLGRKDTGTSRRVAGLCASGGMDGTVRVFRWTG
jgi:mitogen-activated protein kinase organizer 1